MQPKVSVIIPTHNRSWSLTRAVNSVLNQSMSALELIIVDDASTDDTDKVLPLIQDPRVIVVKNPSNLGVSQSRNRGINIANSSWIAFLDSDDEWAHDKIEKQLDYANRNPHIKVIHSNERWIRKGKPLNQLKKHQKFGGRIFDKCLPLCCISPSAVMIHKQVFERCGVFNPEYIVCEDYELWLRITQIFDVGFIEEPLITKYGGHEDQLSHRYKAMDYWRVKALHQLMDSKYITKNERNSLLDTIELKCEILAKGYKRHNNLEHLPEVERIYESARKASASS